MLRRSQVFSQTLTSRVRDPLRDLLTLMTLKSLSFKGALALSATASSCCLAPVSPNLPLNLAEWVHEWKMSRRVWQNLRTRYESNPYHSKVVASVATYMAFSILQFITQLYTALPITLEVVLMASGSHGLISFFSILFVRALCITIASMMRDWSAHRTRGLPSMVLLLLSSTVLVSIGCYCSLDIAYYVFFTCLLVYILDCLKLTSIVRYTIFIVVLHIAVLLNLTLLTLCVPFRSFNFIRRLWGQTRVVPVSPQKSDPGAESNTLEESSRSHCVGGKGTFICPTMTRFTTKKQARKIKIRARAARARESDQAFREQMELSSELRRAEETATYEKECLLQEFYAAQRLSRGPQVDDPHFQPQATNTRCSAKKQTHKTIARAKKADLVEAERIVLQAAQTFAEKSCSGLASGLMLRSY